jgi:SAM-dependent methyltransferase
MYHFLIPDRVIYKKVILPAKYLRYCGRDFHDNEHYLNSALKEADRIIKTIEIDHSSILDVGCGVGRLAIGLLIRNPSIKAYYGVDVSPRAIKWCKKNISPSHSNFNFILMDMKNELYNKEGKGTSPALTFLYGKNLDGIYLYSVFSHMKHEDVISYLQEFKSIIAPTGKIFFTAFLEEHVPDEVENPVNYRMKWTLPLHCVRYNKKYLENILDNSGFKIDRFDYATETDGQSGVYLSLKSS